MNNDQFLQLTTQISEMMSLLQTIQKENQSLKSIVEELKSDNVLLKEENKYLKRKLLNAKNKNSRF